MTDRKKYLRLGAWLLAMALFAFTPAVKLLTNKTAASVILFLETGHVLKTPRPAVPVPETTAPPAETTLPAPEEPVPTQPETVPVFSALDVELVEVNSYCGYTPDVPAWLENPLSWDLRQEKPTVLILHSHATEGYENTKDTNYRTQDPAENMVSVGDALAANLEAAGIRVIHDRGLHDSPSYSSAYENSRDAAKKYLAQYPSIVLVLDLHRDAVADSDGDQIKYTVETEKGTVAKMMLVVGTDAGGLTHTRWPENMSLAVKLQALLNKRCADICRPISFRTQRFNQDLSTGALLVEMGSAGNTRQEALLAAEYLAEAIIDLAKGTE